MANIWKEPIFDRTSHDVAFALQQISAWKQSHSHVGDVNINIDKLTVNADGEVYVNNDSVVLETNANANTQIENNILVLELGVVYDLKGCLNLSDITRIEDNIAYISDRLVRYRYSIDSNSKKWAKDSLPAAQDMKRIIANIRSIFSGFATPSGADTMPETMLSYQDINTIEKNLYLLKQLLDAMEASFVKSGTYKSGAIRLPIRR